MLAAGLRSGLGCARCRGVIELLAVTLQYTLDEVAHVLEQVPAVGDLHCFGRTAPCAIGVDLRAVAGDDLDTGMLDEPMREALCRTPRQQVDGDAALEVDEDGPVGVPLAPCLLYTSPSPRD